MRLPTQPPHRRPAASRRTPTGWGLSRRTGSPQSQVTNPEGDTAGSGAEDLPLDAKGPLSDATYQYLLQEANLMGERIQWYLEQQQHLETLAIVSTGAIWSFLLSLSYTSAVEAMAWLPAVISLLLAGKSYVFTKTLNEAFDYLYELEELCALPGETGWVHFFRSRSGRYKRRWRTGFWTVMALANIFVAQFVHFESLLVGLHST